MSYDYLAGPYSHVDPEVREQRYLEAMRCVAWLLHHKVWAFSPIVHCHEMAKRFKLEVDWTTWEEYDSIMLIPAKRLLILTLEGWEDSQGVNQEALLANALNKPIHFIHPATYKLTEEPNK